MKTKPQEPLFCKTQEVAQILGVTGQTIRAAVQRGEIPGVRLGGQILIRRDAVEALVNSANESVESAS